MSNDKTENRRRPKKGEVLELTFDSLAYGGDAVGRYEGYVIFCRYVAPGDRARVRLMKSKSSYGEAVLEEILERGSERATPPCNLFGNCGGCAWQHIPIEAQHRWKERIVRDSLRSLPDLDQVTFHPLVESPDTWRYRNKMEFTFARNEGGPMIAGFHRPNNWREILPVEHCFLAPEPHERLLLAAVAEAERQGLSGWNPRTYQGTMRQLVLRHSVREQSSLALLLTADEKLDFEAMANALFTAEPSLKGLTWGINDSMSDIARARVILASRGEDSFEEQLGRFRFRVSLASFFQTNSRGAERLYQTTRDALELTGNERLLDAYCGTGTIGIFCADQVRELYGIEIIQEAIWDARSNATLNGVERATFMAGDMRFTLPTLLKSVEGRIDRLVVDPPRGGMDGKALDQLLALRAPIIAYVSCNPTTMARDLEAALKSGYRLEAVTPVDMFPHTFHVECVAKLRLQAAEG